MKLRSLALPIYAPTLLLAFCRGMMIPVLPLYAVSFGVPYALVGIAVSANSFGTLVGDLPAGVLLGRIGTRRTMQLGIACIALSMLAVGATRTFPLLVIFYFLSGVGTALYNISFHTYLTNQASVEQRGRAIATFGGINRIGSFLGPLVGGTLGALFTLRAPFLLFAAVAAIVVIFPTLYAKEDKTGSSAHQHGQSAGDHLRLLGTLVRDHYRIFASAGLGQIFAQTIRSGRQIVIPLFAADMLGLDVQAVGWIVSLSSAADMSLFYVAGMLMDRFGRKFAYVPSFLIQGLGMALVPFTGGFLTLLGATCLLGFGNGLGSGTMMTLGADLAPEDTRGEFLGMWRLIGDGGQTGGPVIVGTVADLFSLPVATFVIAGAGFMAALTLGTLVPETRHPTQVETVRVPGD